MKYLIFLGLLSLAVARKTFFGDQVLTVHVKNDVQAEIVRNLDEKVDFWKPDSPYGIKAGISADIRIPSEILSDVKATLRRRWIPFEVKIEELESLVEAQMQYSSRQRGLFDNFYEVYHTYDEIMSWVSTTVADNQGVATMELIGNSFEGKDIPMLKLSRNPDAPIMLVDCGIHAREWISPAFCQCFVRNLLDPSDGRLDEVTYYVVPLVNPDGYEYTWTNDRMWRKTRSNYGTACTGVDPNRNFDANWSGPGSSSSPCSETYYGPSMASEPEVQALSNVVLTNTITTYITFHSYGQVIIYPYSYANKVTPNEQTLDTLAANGAAAIYDVHRKRFTYGPGYESMYLAAGGSDDFSYDQGVAYSYTVELRDTGRYGFILPETQISDVCDETDAFMKTVHDATRDNPRAA